MIDVRQLDNDQRILLCHQAVKHEDLRQELDLENQEDINCEQEQIKCPRLVIRERDFQKPRPLEYVFCLQNSSQPNTVLIYQEYWVDMYKHKSWTNSFKNNCPYGLIWGMSKDFLEKLKK